MVWRQEQLYRSHWDRENKNVPPNSVGKWLSSVFLGNHSLTGYDNYVLWVWLVESSSPAGSMIRFGGGGGLNSVSITMGKERKCQCHSSSVICDWLLTEV